jgi:alpha-galactosidase
MRVLDEFTLNVLCNPEVIEVDQDPLGKQAKPLVQDDETLIMAKPMADGSLVVGLFNLAEVARDISVDSSLLGFAGSRRIRTAAVDLGHAGSRSR